MTNSNERHRLSLIIATLGPPTDNEKELQLCLWLVLQTMD